MLFLSIYYDVHIDTLINIKWIANIEKLVAHAVHAKIIGQKQVESKIVNKYNVWISYINNIFSKLS